MNFPTLTLLPSRNNFLEGSLDNTISDQAAGAYKFTRPGATRRPKTFTLLYEYMNDTDKAALDDFIENEVFGYAVDFTWSHPFNSNTYQVRFAEFENEPARWKYEGFSGSSSLWTIGFRLEEI